MQPVLFSVHMALAELWLANGLVAQAVVGQSQGEIAAACVAGALSREDAVHVIVSRSQLFAEELVGRGGIASVGLPLGDVVEYLTPYEGRLEGAGIIGSRSVTVAGERAALKDLVAQLNQFGVEVRMVPVSIPSHCAYIEPLRGDELTADYWWRSEPCSWSSRSAPPSAAVILSLP